MKKLNRKGFTLVELLAVIIILAIVVGITIPAILTTTSKAREKAFHASVNSFADWLDRQYQAYQIGDENIAKADNAFKLYCLGLKVNDVTGTGTVDSTSGAGSCTYDDALLTAGGLKSGNYTSGTITFSNGRACVSLTLDDDGDYAGVTPTSHSNC